MPRYFEDLKIGDTINTPARTIFEADIVNFFYLSGDQAEAHSNIESRPDKRPSPPWTLIFALLPGLISRSGLNSGAGPLNPDRPATGESSRQAAPNTGLELRDGIALRGFQFKNLKALNVNDTIHCVIRISGLWDAGPNKGIYQREVKVYNQRNELVQEGWHEFELAKRPR